MMKKIQKNYRLDTVTIERIQILREHYASQGFDLSDAQIIQKAISNLMDVPIGKGVFTQHSDGGKSLSFIKKEGESNDTK